MTSRKQGLFPTIKGGSGERAWERGWLEVRRSICLKFANTPNFILLSKEKHYFVLKKLQLFTAEVLRSSTICLTVIRATYTPIPCCFAVEVDSSIATLAA